MLPVQPGQDWPLIRMSNIWVTLPAGFALGVSALVALFGAPAPAAAQSASQGVGQGGADLAGIDTSETSSKAKGLPWIAHSTAEAFLLQSPTGTGGASPYQVSAYQGFTIQSLTFASFHLGWRYRETLAPGMGGAYRDLFALKLLGTAEILRDHLFVSLGGSIPLVDASASEADTAALYAAMSGYNPMPTPNFAMAQGLQVGIHGRYRLGAWDLMGGASYAQPTRFEPVPGYPYNPASQLGGSARAILETSSARHRFDGKVSRFGDEQTLEGVPAHREGIAAQLRYAWLKASRRTAWQLGLGGLVKTPDQNRPLRLRTALEPAEANDNVQRAYAEAAWTWSPKPTLLWRAWVVPKGLLDGSTRETGREAEVGLAMGLRLWEVHRLRAAGTVLTGSFQGQDYLGFGMKVDFAFRHLGFQDLEAQGNSGEGN